MLDRPTREEVQSAVIDAFVHPPVSRDDLLATAMNAGAAPLVVHALSQLPAESRLHNIRGLWDLLPTSPSGPQHETPNAEQTSDTHTDRR
jgi:hypothetical protein